VQLVETAGSIPDGIIGIILPGPGALTQALREMSTRNIS